MNRIDSFVLLKSYDFEAIANGSSLTCPECHTPDMHMYFYRFEEDDSHGSVWIWCDACHSFTHFQGVIPSWWKNPPFIDESQLTSSPEYFADLGKDIDAWKNQLLSALQGN